MLAGIEFYLEIHSSFRTLQTRVLGFQIVVEAEALRIPDSLHMTCLALFFSQDAYRILALSLVLCALVPMFHGLDSISIYAPGPFSLETSGFRSEIFFFS